MSKSAVIPDRMQGLLSSESLTARVKMSSVFTLAGYGLSQILRMAGNLVLTRLLFPEAFGLMALMSVFIVGLQMFSDFGIRPAIVRSDRGDDPNFLDTAWTIKIIRGVILFLICCGFAYPVSIFYDEPILAGMLMVASVQFLISGLMPTRRYTATRHLNLGYITFLDFLAQAIGLVVIIGLAFWMQTVWALVIGLVLSVAIQTLMTSMFLPGHRNRLRWDKSAVSELVGFGQWIFLSTICGFLLSQGDKLILGKFLPLDTFGIYNIAFFLGSFPMILGMMLVGRLLIPIYRICPPLESRANFLRLRRMRTLTTAGLLTMIVTIAFMGVWVVGFLYDDRYEAAGAIVVLIACMQVPAVIGLTYDQAALAAGDSKHFFIVTFVKALLTITGLLIGVQTYGLIGALAGQALAIVLAYPALVWLSVKIGVWDPLHDLGFAIIGLCLAAGAIWYNWAAITALAA